MDSLPAEGEMQGIRRSPFAIRHSPFEALR
jgi:hypothetical protein